MKYSIKINFNVLKKQLENLFISRIFLQSKIFYNKVYIFYRLAKLRSEDNNFEDLLELNVSQNI